MGIGGRSYNKFIRYFNINEISKFSNFQNIFLLSNIKSISVWFSLDFSLEKSRPIYYSKGLLGIFLIYLITNKYPSIKSSKDKRVLYITSNLTSLDLYYFLEKFLILYNQKHRKDITNKILIKNNYIRLVITDLNIFSELGGCISFFGILEWLHIDIFCDHDEDYRSYILLSNLFKSSYFI